MSRSHQLLYVFPLHTTDIPIFLLRGLSDGAVVPVLLTDFTSDIAGDPGKVTLVLELFVGTKD